MTSKYADVPVADPVEVFAVSAAYRNDTDPSKVNLSVGAYRTDEGKPWVLPVVHKVEEQIAADSNLNHEYLPILGLPDFRSASIQLLLGEGHPAIVENRVVGVQSLGGTGAIRLSADFFRTIDKADTVYVSRPTWGNHKGVYQAAGYNTVKEYRYWDAQRRGLDIEGMVEDLKTAKENSVVILHAVAHNPTGVDPTQDEWKRIADVCQERKLLILMDIAYQGFATGDLTADAWAPRYFASRGFEFLTAQSYSKNFGLYNERIGNLVLVCNTTNAMERCSSQLEIIVRRIWSNPPNHGARVVATVLNNPRYFNEWKDSVKIMADRIKDMREKLYQKLKGLQVPGSWEHIITQIGMFSFTGLDPNQVDKLVKKYHIYLIKQGRINMCGLNSANLDYVAKAIHDVVTN
ncbi:aspartate aminotransferase, cytoplasmic-like [Argonauta hians]